MLRARNYFAEDAGQPSRGIGRLLNGVCRDPRLRGFARSEAGSVTTFSLFIFLMMLFVGGMAVDLMRFETRRAALQNTLDASSLAATNIRSDADAEDLVKDFMAKRGYDPDLTNVSVAETYTGGDPDDPDDRGTLVARGVSANYDLDVNTIFMGLLGIDNLGTTGVGSAKEGLQTVEISLVVDISGSMAGDKIADLKTAAKNFVDQVVDPTRTDFPTTISIIPFNHTVVVPDSLLSRLNTHEEIIMTSTEKAPYSSYRNPLQKYDRTNPNSKCVRFMNDEMLTSNLEEGLDPAMNPNYLLLRAITTTQELDRMQYYRDGSYNAVWCDASNPAILPFGTNNGALKTYIESLTAYGATANDIGLKWGVALLDPGLRPVVSSMVTAGELPSQIDGRPYNYDPTNFMKFVVLMTDGENTQQFDIDDDMKNGPSRVWFSPSKAAQTGNQYDGFYVLMPNNSSSKRFMRPHKLSGNRYSNYREDGELVSKDSVPNDAYQLSYTQLYNMLPDTDDVAMLFYDRNYGDDAAYRDHRDANGVVLYNPNDGEADRRMSGDPSDGTTEYGICDAAKVKNDIIIFTIAFQAGDHAEDVMRDCATSDGYYFDADNGDELYDAFSKIAASITTLRLTQ